MLLATNYQVANKKTVRLRPADLRDMYELLAAWHRGISEMDRRMWEVAGHGHCPPTRLEGLDGSMADDGLSRSAS